MMLVYVCRTFVKRLKVWSFNECMNMLIWEQVIFLETYFQNNIYNWIKIICK